MPEVPERRKTTMGKGLAPAAGQERVFSPFFLLNAKLVGAFSRFLRRERKEGLRDEEKCGQF
jgi:hypothetical protein